MERPIIKLSLVSRSISVTREHEGAPAREANFAIKGWRRDPNDLIKFSFLIKLRTKAELLSVLTLPSTLHAHRTGSTTLSRSARPTPYVLGWLPAQPTTFINIHQDCRHPSSRGSLLRRLTTLWSEQPFSSVRFPLYGPCTEGRLRRSLDRYGSDRSAGIARLKHDLQCTEFVIRLAHVALDSQPQMPANDRLLFCCAMVRANGT